MLARSTLEIYKVPAAFNPSASVGRHHGSRIQATVDGEVADWVGASAGIRSEQVCITTASFSAAADTREAEGKMWCQACQQPVPFNRLDGEPYFEAVQILDQEVLAQHHVENYLALCANHAAMFKHSNASRGELKDLVMAVDAEAETKVMPLAMGGSIVVIRFDTKHLIALQEIVRVPERTD